MGLVGRYETYELLGKGSVGSVYRARDVLLDRDVAVKILHRNASFDPELSNTLARHGSIGAKLLHPNIATVYDFRETPQFSFLVCDLLKGTDLRFKSHNTNKFLFSLVQKIDLLAQVCDGLAHAHSCGLIHRDIKPSNIFIHDKKYAKLLDFGIRRAPRQNATATDGPAGTLDYVSPEQILTSHCEARSDTFSAAIVFFEFLVGNHPFGGPFIPRRIVEEAPEKLCEHDRLIPRSLERLFETALSKTLEKRIQTAEHFADELRHVGQELRADLASTSAVISFSNPGGESKSLTRKDPAADDPVDWRVAVLIRELRSFDDSLAFGDLEIARGTLARMLGLEAGDDRLSTAIKDCQARLESAEVHKVSPRTISTSSEEGPIAQKPPIAKDREVLPPSSKGKPSRLVKTGWVASRRLKDFLLSRQQIWGQSLMRLARLTMGQKQVAATIGVAGMLLITSLLIYKSKANAPERAQVLAKIEVPHAELFEKPSPSSRRLMNLQQGMTVGVLENSPTIGQPFVRVRVVSGKNKTNPGYLRTGDLSEWTSDDPAIAWRLLSTFRPSQNAKAGVLQHFAEELQRFQERFPRSPHVAEADRERQKIGEIVTNQLARANPRTEEVSGASEQTSEDRELAKRTPVGIMPTHPKAAVLSSLASDRDPTGTTRRSEEVDKILRELPGLWDDGNLEEIVGLTQKALALAPNDDQAKKWNAKARNAIRKLNAQ